MRIRNLLGSAAALAAISSLAEGMDFFEGKWDEAFEAAEANGQLVFVDVYTDWCGPCKLMDANVYPDDAVGAYFNPRFVNIKLDAEDEDVNGPEIAARYDIGGYPTLLFLNPDGSELGRGVAGLDVEQLIQLAREVTGAEASAYADMSARYDAGERDGAFVQAFLKAALVESAKLFDDFDATVAHHERMTPVFDDYLATRDQEDLINAADFAVIAAYKAHVLRGDPVVEFVIDNYDAFAEVAPENALAAFVLESNYYTVQSLAYEGDEAYLEQLDMLDGPLRRAAEFQRTLDPDDALLREYQEAAFKATYLAQTGQWAELKQTVEAQLAEPDADRVAIYTDAATDFLGADEEEYRELGHQYAKLAYELDPSDPFGASTYAGSLADKGRTAEAIAVLEKAIAAEADRQSGLAAMLTEQLAALKEPTDS